MNFQMMISAIGQQQLGLGDDWGYWLYISFVVISSFNESLTETQKKQVSGKLHKGLILTDRHFRNV